MELSELLSSIAQSEKDWTVAASVAMEDISKETPKEEVVPFGMTL